MEEKFGKLKIGLVFIFVLLTFMIVRVADAAYSVTVKEIDSGNYPQIQLSFKLAGSAEDLFARNFSIYENSKRNNGPIVLLPPKAPSNKIDLFILLDRSGNTKSYESIIKSNLKSLVNYMKNSEIDLQVNLIDFGSSVDSAADAVIKTFTSAVDFDNSIDGLIFDSARPSKIYVLNKVVQFAKSQARSGAEKVLLMVNGSQSYDGGLGGSTAQEAAIDLLKGGFTIFVAGYPLKQLHALRTVNAGDNSSLSPSNAGDNSLSHSVPGGYLGGFAIDLTVIHDLLQKQSPENYILQYYSENPGGGSAQLYIQNNFVDSFSYSRVSSDDPVMNDATGMEAAEGQSLPIRIEVVPNGQLINVVEIAYLDKSVPSVPKPVKSVLIHEKTEDTENNMIYTGKIPEGAFPQSESSFKFMQYYVNVYTPYNVIENNPAFIPVFAYDEGIILNPPITIKNLNGEVLSVGWSWKGPTVDMGDEFEVWEGDIKIATTKERNITLPVGECDKYQVVKVRAHFKPGVPKAGTWSNFSRPGERFTESDKDGEITESEGIDIMIKCLKDKKYQTSSSYTKTESNYSASKKLNMDKAAYYAAGITEPAFKDIARISRYDLLYYLMNFISRNEYLKYSDPSALIPRSMVYKIVTNSNQKSDLDVALKAAVEYLALSMKGIQQF